MRNVYLVIKHEIASTFAKPYFWIMTFLFPILILGLNIGMQVMSERAFMADEVASAGPAARPVGYVDPGNAIAVWPPSTPDGLFERYPDEAAAQAALDAGQIDRYYIVPADWVESGDLVLVDRAFKPFGNVAGGGLFEYALSYNLVGDGAVAGLLMDPTPRVESTGLAPHWQAGREGMASYWVPYGTMYLFFFTLMMSSSLLLQSVSKEKETRTAEVLLLSLRPRELVLGKVIGLGLLALVQLLIWAAGGILLLGRGDELLAALSAFALPRGFIVWLVLYFVFGYAVYGSILGAIGVLAPTAREGAQFTFVAMLPMMIPLFLNYAFTEDPHGTLATVLSLFPLTAPLSMVARLVGGGVPFWQPVVGLLALAATAYGFVLLAARLFRADNLLSDASLSWGRIVKELHRK